MAKPKVISLIGTEKIDNIFLNVAMVGRPTDIFVRCTSYDLKIPMIVSEVGELDIFEETVLRMLNVKKCTASELADVLCLEKDLVNFILIRLQEKGFLVDKYTLSDSGKQELGHQKELREDIEYKTAKIFIVNGCDIMLPYIYMGDFVSEDIVEFNPSSITLGFGSIGNQRRISGACIREKTSDSKMSILPTTTIRNAIKKFNRLAVKRNKTKIDLADKYSIESTRGEDIYFHMQMAVQAGNIEEMLVSDGFVSNIDGLSDFIKKIDSDLLMRVQSKAVQMNTEANSEEEKQQRVYSGKYPEVVKYCREMEKNIHLISDNSSLDDIRQLNEDECQAVINCYSMLEWAFFYHALRYPISQELQKVLKGKNKYDNYNTIKNLAKRIGINNLDKYGKIFSNFDGNRVASIYKNPKSFTPTMQEVLPMAFLSASEHEESELKKLLSMDRHFLSFIVDLGNEAGNLRHDSLATVNNIVPKEMSSRAIKIIRTILPDIVLSRDSITEIEHVSNDRLKATVACEKSLGSMLYNSLDDGIQASFRKISPDKSAEELPDAYEYVQTLANILQTTFFKESKEYLSSKWLSKEECIKKLESVFETKLPRGITTVNENRYNMARKGMSVTLGAHFLVLFSLLDIEVVEQLKSLDILSLVDKILYYRKHNNDIFLMVSNEELFDMRDRVINTLKILGGYYYD